MVDVNRFVSGCRFIGGQIRDDGKYVACVLSEDLKIQIDKKHQDVQVVDHRAKPGRNLVTINDIDRVETDDRRIASLIVYAGDSNVSVGRDGDVVTTLQPEFSYPRIHEETPRASMVREPELRIPVMAGVEACPVGSKVDDRTGVCIPRPEMRDELTPHPVYEAHYSDVGWSESDDDLILVNGEHTMAKASLGTWLNSKLPMAKSFKQAKQPLSIELVIGDEMRGRTPAEGPQHTIRIGNSLYDRRLLYSVAEEIVGEKIFDSERDLPVKAALGRKLPFKILQSEAENQPIVVKGERDVFYYIAPKVEAS